MKVLLISANVEKINLVPLPLGLIYVAAAVHKAGHRVKVLDFINEKQDRRQQWAIPGT